MAQHKNDKKYTAADFEQYHNGTMPKAEMYALEKAALEDPFLSDALDGYVFTATAQDDIYKLKQKIAPQKENKKTSPVISFRTMWLRIAAVFILVGGISYISYVSLNKRTDETFAKLEEPPKTQTSTQPVITDADKIAPAQQQAVTEDKTIQQEKTQTFDRLESKEEPAGYTADAPVQRSENEVAAIMPAPVASYQERSINNKYILKGQVTNKKGEAVPFATVQTNDEKTNVSADANGRFSIAVKDSIAETSVAALGYATAKKTLKADDEQKIILEQKQSLEEVVVVGYGNTKSKNMTASTATVDSKDLNNGLAGKVSGIDAVTTSQPINGEALYEKYISESLKAPLDANQQPYAGSVELSFKVDNNGRPGKIKVEKSLCAACDAEAIRLLKNGPKWTYNKGNRTTTIINFN